MQDMKRDLKEYYEKNREWLQAVAQGGNTVTRCMALAILKLGSDSEQ